MKKPKNKQIPFSYYKYLQGAKAVTASGIEVVYVDWSYESNCTWEGRIATDPMLKVYWHSNGKAHGNNPEHDLKLEVTLTFWERLWNLWNF